MYETEKKMDGYDKSVVILRNDLWFETSFPFTSNILQENVIDDALSVILSCSFFLLKTVPQGLNIAEHYREHFFLAKLYHFQCSCSFYDRNSCVLDVSYLLPSMNNISNAYFFSYKHLIKFWLFVDWANNRQLNKRKKVLKYL